MKEQAVTGIAFLILGWFIFSITPFFGSSGFLGLSEIESKIVSILTIVGYVIGYIIRIIEDLKKSNDKLQQRVIELEIRTS